MVMMRVAAATVPVGLLACALVTARTPARLSADEIVARSVAARGGLDAWRKVGTMVWIGRVESAHTPSPTMRFTLEQKRPNLTRLQLEAPGYRSVRAFDGVRGWKVRPGRDRPEVQPYTPQELAWAQESHGIDGPLVAHAAEGGAVALEAVDALGPRKAYHLRIALTNGGSEDVWVDTETFLEVRHDRMADGPTGAPRRVSATYADYRTVDGVKLPFLIQTGGGPGTTPDRMVLERVVLNVPLEDSTFGNPSDPRPLRRAVPPRVAPPLPALAPVSTASRAEGGSARP
jgi:hypothetical protein